MDLRDRSNLVDSSFMTYENQNLTEVPSLAYEYMNNISGYDLMSDENSSMKSNGSEKEETEKSIKKEKIVSVNTSKNNSQKKFVLNKKLFNNYNQKIPKVNTSMSYYNSKTIQSNF